MIAALMCIWLVGAEAPIVCLDPQACEVRARIMNHNERRPIAVCRSKA